MDVNLTIAVNDEEEVSYSESDLTSTEVTTQVRSAMADLQHFVARVIANGGEVHIHVLVA